MSFVERSRVMRRITVLVVVAIATSLAVGATLARAASPTREWVEIDDTFTWDDCGFPIEQHDVATLHFTRWLDDSGVRTREIVTAPGSRSTWTNAETGASVTSVTPYVVVKEFNPDGSAVITFTGLSFAIQGGGRAYVSSGRAVILFADGSVEPLSGSGPSADLCEALTAAIG
jgi:prepilin-type processing-associated H-X9-DG protein